MFTGIIQHIGVVGGLLHRQGGARLTITAAELATAVSDGASICVSGVCLTVARRRPSGIEFDVVAETLERSTLGELRRGDRVNLEQSLRVGDRVDGHFVQGHVDATATLIRRYNAPSGHILWFKPESPVDPYLIPKGSVAIDGVSLTIAALDHGAFSVALIPTTLKLTTLGDCSVGNRVNIETDLLVRAVVGARKGFPPVGGLHLEMLETHGFA